MRKQLLPFVDRALGGTLKQRLTEMRSEGCSYREMSHRLRDLDIDVSDETVRKWVRELDVDPTKPSPAQAVGE